MWSGRAWPTQTFVEFTRALQPQDLVAYLLTKNSLPAAKTEKVNVFGQVIGCAIPIA